MKTQNIARWGALVAFALISGCNRSGDSPADNSPPKPSIPTAGVKFDHADHLLTVTNSAGNQIVSAQDVVDYQASDRLIVYRTSGGLGSIFDSAGDLVYSTQGVTDIAVARDVAALREQWLAQVYTASGQEIVEAEEVTKLELSADFIAYLDPSGNLMMFDHQGESHFMQSSVDDFELADHAALAELSNHQVALLPMASGEQFLSASDVVQIGGTANALAYRTSSGQGAVLDAKGAPVLNLTDLADVQVSRAFVAYRTHAGAGELLAPNLSAVRTFPAGALAELEVSDAFAGYRLTSGAGELLNAGGQSLIWASDSLARVAVSKRYAGWLQTSGMGELLDAQGETIASWGGNNDDGDTTPSEVSTTANVEVSDLYAVYVDATGAGQVFGPDGYSIASGNDFNYVAATRNFAAYGSRSGGTQIWGPSGYSITQVSSGLSSIDVSDWFADLRTNDGASTLYGSEGQIAFSEADDSTLNIELAGRHAAYLANTDALTVLDWRGNVVLAQPGITIFSLDADGVTYITASGSSERLNF